MDMETVLGNEAISYIKDRLSNGQTLAKFLLANSDLDSGKVVTFLPPSANHSRVRDFKRGGLLPTRPESEWIHAIGPIGQQFVMKPVPKADEGLVRVIQNFLKSSKAHLCIFENSLARPSDPYLKELLSSMLILGEEVYHLLKSEDADEKTIRNTVSEARSYLEIGAMTSTTLPDQLFTKKEITANELKTLALNTQNIVVGAYDGEGYLIWSKPEPGIKQR